MKTIAFHNLGCKVNSYELDLMQQMSQKEGWQIVQFEQKADIYVINTCSVTNIADRKSRQAIHKARKENPDALVIAVGCFVQADPEGALADGAADIIIGNNRKVELTEIIKGYFDGKDVRENVIDVQKCDYEEMKLEGSAEHTRAYVKIQDGCDRYCSYCIIPYTRGRVRSRKPEDVVSEVTCLAARGYSEVVLTGIHISSYGKDFGDKDMSGKELLALLNDINGIEGIQRIRIGSFEPMILSEEFVKELAKVDKLCPHFHISLQSGCDRVLKRMNRHYDTEKYFEKTVLLRKYFPGCAITTDVIVGFPGETKEEFEETVEYLTKIKFFELHVFPYSRRKGTVADKMDGQLTEKEKKERVAVLLELDRKYSSEFRASKKGEKTTVIAEEIKTVNGKDYLMGFTPEYIRVALETCDKENRFGQTIEVTLGDEISEGIVSGI